MTAEQQRLDLSQDQKSPWRKWGPYLTERQWGTVREDYSENGDAWNFFPHDHARSRAYRWGEDGLGGISDDEQRLCFSLALWNGNDPILKERLFGLTNSQGNHGEDVKEYYFYLDSTPTHSYMKFLYKYPQAAYPYDDLVATNGRRGRLEMEYELLDTGVFNEDRYFDVYVEYAKASPEDILIRITAWNRGPDEAELHLLPTLWFRNDWAPWITRRGEKPLLQAKQSVTEAAVIGASHATLGEYLLFCEGAPTLLFTENSTNHRRLHLDCQDEGQYFKDGINDWVVGGQADAVNPVCRGTKASACYRQRISAGQSATLSLRLVAQSPTGESEAGSERTGASTDATLFGKAFEAVFATRREESDEFYQAMTPPSVSPDAALVMRQSLAGMLWSKQFYYWDGDAWLKEHHAHPLHQGSRASRNRDWFHMINADIISMPDKWEYPWYAAWDLAFQTLPLSMVDLDFAKQQLKLMLRGLYLHPSGQIPAYEWNFSDVNPPVHAWATLFLHRSELAARGAADVDFVKSMFNKLTLNFSWWVNRKDRFGNNVFEGGFLGLDNIGIFDRSSPLPTGGYLEQADGTAWMALFTQNMLELALELVPHDAAYEDMTIKFAEHFYYIAAAMNKSGSNGMWDEEDGFYYDLLRLPDGNCTRLKVRSMVGLLPLCATTVIEKWQRDRVPEVDKALRERMRQIPELMQAIHPTGPGHFGVDERGILAIVNPDRLRRILTKMLDEGEFLSPYGIRSISKVHEQHPYRFETQGVEYRVEYLPAESDSGMFGGNSNWRGPIWMPVNAMIIRALLNFHLYYGDHFTIECPTGSGKMMNLFEVAKEIADRLGRIFTRDEHGRRAVFGGSEKFQNDPNWRNHLLFYEYFHGDNGAGLGASHQTGWTGLIAKFIQMFGGLDAQRDLQVGKRSAFGRADHAGAR